MKATEWMYLMVTHPNEVRALLQYGLWTEHREIEDPKEWKETGWDRPTMKECWKYLDMTSRSFSAVIKDLEGDLARVICLFYLVLRCLDTIEDDMTIDVKVKQPLLRVLYEKLSEPGWTFDGNAPTEKDRELVVHFDVVIAELANIKKEYYIIIRDICKKMGKGMADFADRSSSDRSFWVETIEEYDLYCHYVAGLVGEGLSRLFAATGKEADWLADQLELSNSTGMLLQKTNITRDFREDVDDGRHFWPREIWGQYGFSELKQLTEPQNEQRAMQALSAMTVDALRHATDALDYLLLLKNQSVFGFVAIPQVMAMATLALVYQNKAVLQRNVKIRRGQMVQLIGKSTNPRDVAYIFRDYARVIHHKSSPSDPNFLRISVACGKIEQWAEHHYPSFIALISGAEGSSAIQTSSSDARVRLVAKRQEKEKQMKAEAKRLQAGLPAKQANSADDNAPWWLIIAMLTVTILVFALTALLAVGILWYFDLLKDDPMTPALNVQE